MLAAHHRLPAIYAFRVYVAGGGLMSYGPDATTPYRRAAGYIDRIFKGEKPADLPVQAPTKYVADDQLKTAKAIGLTVPRDIARPRRRGDRNERAKSDLGHQADMKLHPGHGHYLSDNADLRDFSTSLNNEALRDSTVSSKSACAKFQRVGSPCCIGT